MQAFQLEWAQAAQAGPQAAQAGPQAAQAGQRVHKKVDTLSDQ